jgi:methylase of polypeptide subunit release factors
MVTELASKYRFLHWPLEFADLFHERGGFDLIVGNPPWIKVEWE